MLGLATPVADRVFGRVCNVRCRRPIAADERQRHQLRELREPPEEQKVLPEKSIRESAFQT